jgi:hypothetical protein
MCCTRRDDTYECFSVENFSEKNNRRLIVCIDLESLYEQIGTIDIDTRCIYKGIFHILDKNNTKHIGSLQKMMEYKANFEMMTIVVSEQNNKYKTYLNKFETMLNNLLTAEKNIINEIIETERKYSMKKTLYEDIEKVHIISKKDNELSRISELKQEIISNILKVKSVLENLSLKVDQICFDNTVMLNTIINNFEDLNKI